DSTPGGGTTGLPQSEDGRESGHHGRTAGEDHWHVQGSEEGVCRALPGRCEPRGHGPEAGRAAPAADGAGPERLDRGAADALEGIDRRTDLGRPALLRAAWPVAGPCVCEG